MPSSLEPVFFVFRSAASVAGSTARPSLVPSHRCTYGAYHECGRQPTDDAYHRPPEDTARQPHHAEAHEHGHYDEDHNGQEYGTGNPSDHLRLPAFILPELSYTSTAGAGTSADAAFDPDHAVASAIFHPPFPGVRSVVVQIPMQFRLQHLVREGVVDRRVDLRAQQHDRCGEIEVEEQTHGCSQAPVGDAVVCEVRQVDGEAKRGDRPQNHCEG